MFLDLKGKAVLGKNVSEMHDLDKPHCDPNLITIG